MVEELWDFVCSEQESGADHPFNGVAAPGCDVRCPLFILIIANNIPALLVELGRKHEGLGRMGQEEVMLGQGFCLHEASLSDVQAFLQGRVPQHM